MGCCILAIFGAAWPRLVLILIYLFNPAIPQKAFHTLLWPLVGFLFLPTTTLAYELTNFYIQGGTSNLWSILLIAIAFLHDLGQLGLFRNRRRA